jgi:hypothetical protein
MPMSKTTPEPNKARIAMVLLARKNVGSALATRAIRLLRWTLQDFLTLTRELRQRLHLYDVVPLGGIAF